MSVRVKALTRRVTVAGAVAGIACLTSITPAVAGPFGSTSCGGTPKNCVNLAHDADVTYAWDGVIGNQFPGIGKATNWAADNDYTPTDLTYYKPISGTIDVRVADYSYGNNGVAGWVVCPVGAQQSSAGDPLRWCIGQVLRYNGSYASNFTTTTMKRSLACHEMGHTVGLQHYASSTSCMPKTINGVTTLNAADIANINGWY